jgi:hypothetical protein
MARLVPAFSGLEAFFDDYVRGTRELDYDTYLGYAGLKREGENCGSAPPRSGAAKATCRVKEISHPSPEQLQVREGWLRGETIRAGGHEQ